MKRLFQNFFASMPAGARLLVLVFALAYPVAWVGIVTHAFNLPAWLDLSPALVWKGQLWRVVTYGYLAGGAIDWAVGTFWLATLAAVVGRNWSSLGFWGYCTLGVVAGALPFALLQPDLHAGFAGSAALVFVLLMAWDWLYRNERLLLLGIGEISVRRAVILVWFIYTLILFFCCGWMLTLSMWCSGVAGRLWLMLRAKLFLGNTPQQIRSERVARLEL
jgi:membrane associated rhomboid family serine protease